MKMVQIEANIKISDIELVLKRNKEKWDIQFINDGINVTSLTNLYSKITICRQSSNGIIIAPLLYL